MANEQNLKPFQPGNRAGVGHGRPKGSVSLSKLLEKALTQQIDVRDGTGEKKQVAELIVASMLKQALKGDMRAQKEIWDRIEGKAVAIMELTGKDGSPIALETPGLLAINSRIEELSRAGENSDNKAPLPH